MNFYQFLLSCGFGLVIYGIAFYRGLSKGYENGIKDAEEALYLVMKLKGPLQNKEK